MRLSDIVSSMNLAIYPQIALVIFLAVFISVSIRIYTRPRSSFDHQLHLPLEDTTTTPTTPDPS